LNHAARTKLAAPGPDTVAPEGIEAWARPRGRQRQDRPDSEGRATSGRKRAADPPTPERDNAAAEMELIRAMQDSKQRSGRMFPTWSEVLEVLKSLGYQKHD
jgi:hypothetical protein